MRFYDAIQLDPSCLKPQIRAAEDKKEKARLWLAIATRSFFIVVFAIMMIAPVSPLFGAENSPMAVAMFCIFLGLRFVDFGYRMQDSLVNLAIVFLLLCFAPSAAAQVNVVFAALIHVSAFFIILFMTSDSPEMGNAGVYTFAYIYLSGNPVWGMLLWKRALFTSIAYICCALLLFAKHRNKNKEVRFWDMVKNISLKNKKTQWHLQLALGVGLILALGGFFQFKRMMWAAFACGSILGCYGATAPDAMNRSVQRMVGCVGGSLVFFVLYPLLPESLQFLVGPLGGFCMGFCADYRFKTACNCLGAIFMATSLYGVQESVFLRVVQNFAGVIFGFLFLLIYQKVMQKCLDSQNEENVEIATA